MTAGRPGSNQQVVPRPRSSAGRAGRSIPGEDHDDRRPDEPETTPATGLPKAYRARPSSRPRSTSAGWPPTSSRPTAPGRGRTRRRPPFVIIQPPPNVTGALHLGHALTADVEDVMIRRARMQGRPTLWLPGLDHASIAAQFVLDRIIAAEGESRDSLGRSATSSGCRRSSTRPARRSSPRAAARLVARLGPDPVHDGRGLARRRSGRRSRACIDDGPGLPDRGPRQLVPGLSDQRSATSRSSRRPRPGRCGRSATTSSTRGRPGPTIGRSISVATTRPETILGDVAVAVHPDDPRYAGLVGRLVAHPVRRSGRADHRRPDRPAGVRDRGGQDHAGPRPRRPRDRPAPRPARDHGHATTAARIDARRPVRTPASTGTRRAPGSWPTSRRAATSIEAKPHEMIIGRCQRSNDVIEPRLKTQWFIRTSPLAGRRSRPPGRAARGSCPTGSRRSGSTG